MSIFSTSKFSIGGESLIGTFLSIISISAFSQANPDVPTTIETLRLPHYCQGQLIPKLRGLPGYTQPNNCGVYMNHFCYGLNFLNRASDLNKSKGLRKWNAERARTDIDYTRQHMLPGCGIAQDVQAADMRLRALEMFLK